MGNRTRDLPGCSAVPQPSAPPLTLSNVNITAPLLAPRSLTTEMLRLLQNRLMKASHSCGHFRSVGWPATLAQTLQSLKTTYVLSQVTNAN